SWPVGTVTATDRVAEWTTYAGPEARRPAPAGRAPGPDLLRPACRSRPLPHDRPACNGSGGLGQDDGELHSGATELRPSQTARQGVGGAGRRHPALPPPGGRIPDRGLYLKSFHRIYAPLTAGIVEPVFWDERLPPERR